jgi:hypothetical protein
LAARRPPSRRASERGRRPLSPTVGKHQSIAVERNLTPPRNPARSWVM